MLKDKSFETKRSREKSNQENIHSEIRDTKVINIERRKAKSFSSDCLHLFCGYFWRPYYLDFLRLQMRLLGKTELGGLGGGKTIATYAYTNE